MTREQVTNTRYDSAIDILAGLVSDAYLRDPVGISKRVQMQEWEEIDALLESEYEEADMLEQIAEMHGVPVSEVRLIGIVEVVKK
ncbi:MAG: hypothetical protein WCJ56_00475 [bacterium]